MENGDNGKPKEKVIYRRQTNFELDVMRTQHHLRASELGQIFGVHQLTIYRWADTHRIFEIRRGRYRYFSGDEFIEKFPTFKKQIEKAYATPAKRWSATKLVKFIVDEHGNEVQVTDTDGEDG